MSTTKKPRNNPTAIITQDNVSHAISDLEDMAKRPKRLSLMDVVEQIQPYVRAALAQGYSPEDICRVLAKRNITLAPQTLKRYLKRLENSKGTKEGTQANELSPPGSEGEDLPEYDASEGDSWAE